MTADAAKTVDKTLIRYQIQNAADLLSDLHSNSDMPLSVNWSISPRNIDLGTGLVGQVYHLKNDRDRTLADLQNLARILGSPMILGPAYHQEKHREHYQILADIKGVPVRIWAYAYVRRERAATARKRVVG